MCPVVKIQFIFSHLVIHKSFLPGRQGEVLLGKTYKTVGTGRTVSGVQKKVVEYYVVEVSASDYVYRANSFPRSSSLSISIFNWV